MEISIAIISIFALIFSIIGFIITLIQNQKLAKENIRLQEATFYMERNAGFEGKLAEWPDAFKFYGIDLEKAKEDNISKEQLTFLIMSINALCAVCKAKGKSIYDHIKDSDYRKRMFSHKETRDTWKCARKCFSEHRGKDIDKYLKEKYPGEEFEI